MKKKSSISDYTEEEFVAFVQNIYLCNGSEQEMDQWVEEFIALAEHPDGSDLIFYPKDDTDDSPEGIVAELKQWRQSQGLPCFKE